MSDRKVRPSRWYYALAGAVFIAGWVLFAIILFKNLSGMGAKLQQVVVPGTGAVTLREPGNYTIYYEYHSVVGNKVYSTEENLSGLACTLVSRATNSKVPLSPTSSSSSYELGGRSGKSIFDFKIQQPGVYDLSAGYFEGHEGPEVVLAVGRGFTLGTLGTVFGSLAAVFGCMALAVAIAVVTLVKRSNAKKKRKAAA